MGMSGSRRGRRLRDSIWVSWSGEGKTCIICSHREEKAIVFD